jgi:exopolysaccharide biosynthesis protein
MEQCMQDILAMRQRRKERRRRIRQRIFHAFAYLGITLLSLAIFVFGGAAMIHHGPSKTVRDTFVITVMETSAAKFLATLYYTPDEIDAIIQANAVKETTEVTDVNLVEIPSTTDSEPDSEQKAIEIHPVTGPTFKGKMMIVKDPSRVYLSTCPTFGKDAAGMRVEEMIERDGAIGGINAGGFADEGGVGNGGQPLGLVISQGKYLAGNLNTPTSMAGFDQDHKLVVGNLTGQQAKDLGLRDAVSFGPVLIVNGKRAEVQGTGGGVNPRTAIGQRADGSVLLLVIDGRQPHSIGATYKDIIDVMEQFEAVNACNMDGGSSSLMFYEGELITTCASLYGSRQLPTAWLVK